MNTKILIVALALTAFLSPSAALAQRSEPPPKRPDPISQSDFTYRYRLFETTNIWTFILLDTATGRAWQVHYSTSDTPTARYGINESSLLPEGATQMNGRFVVYATQNMYNFLLLDREDSRIWQLQWSFEPKNRGIMRSFPPPM
jgi:hypothetical protein